MARTKIEPQLAYADERLQKWARSSNDEVTIKQLTGDKGANPLHYMKREKENLGIKGTGSCCTYGIEEDEIEAIVRRLPAITYRMVWTEYKEGGIQQEKAKRLRCSLTDYKKRLDGALWVVWAWLESGQFKSA